MKICSKCGVLKDDIEFSLVHPAKHNGKIRPDCKECVRERSSRVRKINPTAYYERLKVITKASKEAARSFANEYLSGHPCVDCGISDIDVLDFDHVSGNKVCDVSRMIAAGYRIWRIEEEIAKCEIRCANCHRRMTARRRRMLSANVA